MTIRSWKNCCLVQPFIIWVEYKMMTTFQLSVWRIGLADIKLFPFVVLVSYVRQELNFHIFYFNVNIRYFILFENTHIIVLNYFMRKETDKAERALLTWNKQFCKLNRKNWFHLRGGQSLSTLAEKFFSHFSWTDRDRTVVQMGFKIWNVYLKTTQYP